MQKILIIFIVFGLIIGIYYFLKSSNKKEEKQIMIQPTQPQTPMQETIPISNIPKEKELVLTSSLFEHMGKIPVKYTCDGQNINPALKISGVSVNAQSLVLIMEDLDVPKSIRSDGIWNHWLKFNLSSSLTEIEEGANPGGISGLGTSKTLKYIGPCPPDKEHRYFFKLFSLDTILDLKKGATKSQIEEAMRGHILQEAVLVGVYERD